MTDPKDIAKDVIPPDCEGKDCFLIEFKTSDPLPEQWEFEGFDADSPRRRYDFPRPGSGLYRLCKRCRTYVCRNCTKGNGKIQRILKRMLS